MFDSRKTAQAAAWLIDQSGGAINYMVLIKLLYLADRQTLIETGYPITGDIMVAMPHGPVLSRTYDQINTGERTYGQTAWYEYITEPDGSYVVRAKKAAETDELSAYELAILEAMYKRFGQIDKWVLVDYTHTLPEWSDPHGSSSPIQPETILRAVGRSDAEIRAMTETAEEVWFIRSLAGIGQVGSG